jgi:hypothetical protein
MTWSRQEQINYVYVDFPAKEEGWLKKPYARVVVILKENLVEELIKGTEKCNTQFEGGKYERGWNRNR